AVSPTNAWAVGSTDPDGSPSGGNDLIVHFDGSGWKQVPSPITTSSALAGVKARAANDVWAVGQVAGGQFSTRTLVLHFNGTSWTRIPSPSPGSTASLAAVTATSATNAWAVGVYQSGFRRLLLLEHWNGHTWRRVVAPRVPKDFVDAQLLGVTALSARNVWAVGTMTTCGCGPGAGVILHFNGRRWRRLPASARIQTLSGVSASSAGRVWAVGVSGDGDAPTRAE